MALAEKLWTGLWELWELFRPASTDSAVLLDPTPLCKVNLTSTARREVIHSSHKVERSAMGIEHCFKN
jgi:hypothetical protein